MPARSDSSEAPSAQRYVFLDGLRGWGAVVVVLFHYLVQVFPPSTQASSVLRHVIFFNGSMAVWVFFVVSGFSLSIGFIRRNDGLALARLGIGRYPRLAIPVVVACSLVHIMMISGVIYAPDQRPEILRPFLSFEPTVSHLARFSLFRVFLSHSLFESYIPPLWTMSVELIGSALVIALVAIFGRRSWRIWLYLAVTIALMAFDSFYSLFMAGVVLAELYARGVPDADWFRGTMFAGVLAGLAVPIFFGDGVPDSLGLFGIVMWCAAWIFLPPLRRSLESRVSRWLGRISFPLYLVHAPLVYSLSLYVLRRTEATAASPALANLIVVVVSVAAAFVAARAFTPVNECAISFSRWLGKATVAWWLSVFRRSQPEPLAPAL